METAYVCYRCHRVYGPNDLVPTWCVSCGHRPDRPAEFCDCPMCYPPATGPELHQVAEELTAIMPIGVDPQRWMRAVGQLLAFVPDDVAGMLTVYHALCNGLLRLATLAISDADTVTRNVRALEVMADVAEELADVAEVG
jgi:hypothetical protein